MRELVYARNRVREESITLHTAIEETARNIVRTLQ